MYGLSANEITEHLHFLESIADIVEPVTGRPIVLTDPKDDPVIYTAVAAGADILCTRDHHCYASYVLAFCASEDIRIMDELQLLAILD